MTQAKRRALQQMGTRPRGTEPEFFYVRYGAGVSLAVLVDGAGVSLACFIRYGAGVSLVN